MWQWLSRILMVGCFLALIWLAVNPAAQGQGSGKQVLSLPLMVHNAVMTVAPPLRNYMGILHADPDGDAIEAYYAVRGDGSDWRQLTSEWAIVQSGAWSPNGVHFVYYENGLTKIIRVSDLFNVVSFTNEFDTVIWSPDSRYLFKYHNSGALSISDLELKTLNQAGGIFTRPDTIQWSGNSRYVAWMSEGPGESTRRLWVWDRETSIPRMQGVGTFNLGYPSEIYWSPSGNQIALVGWKPDSPYIPRIFVSQADQTGVEMILERYDFLAWVQAGERLFVQLAGQVYMASADGTEIVPFSDPTHDLGGVVQASNRHIAYIFNGTQYLHSVGEESPIALGSAFCTLGDEGCVEDFRWMEDGTRLLHIFGIDNRQTRWTNFDIWDTTLNPPRFVARVDNMDPPHQFLPFADNYLAITNYTGEDPEPSYIDSYIFNGGTGELWHVPYEQNGQRGVLEWRYMP